MKPRVNIVYFPGTNCQRETMRAFEKVGAVPRVVFAEDVVAGHDRLDDADVLCIPGGFSYGDHVRAGTVAASILRLGLSSQLAAYRAKPVLCICNGFQIAARAGIFGNGVALSVNANQTFLHRTRQRHLVTADNRSLWLAGMSGAVLEFPCAHGEGRFTFTSREGWESALHYPPDENPDGSFENIAGVSTPDGLTLGLMNHPERAQHRAENLQIFENGVRYVAG